MKKRYCVSIILLLLYTACSDMNESLDPYLSKGEIIYIAKSDSVKIYSGNERFLLQFWMSDPRAVELCVYWSQKGDSLIIPIAEDRNITEPIELFIGKNEKIISEGNYTLNLVTRDKYKNMSVIDEYNANVYGEKFASSLLNKYVKSVEAIGDSILKIAWGGAYSSTEYGIKLFYVSKENSNEEQIFTTEILKKEMNLTDVDVKQPIYYSTIYLPEPTAVDTFYTEKVLLKITK
ncbi:DUF4998 domain-containing protein [Parabacteroides sp. Marseille-P3160]|uniref:DUF4998 domain-containing protein n=1 Tax=Parabacteroides sp. Marseille-P3160 TaxID=1917887 RepID=UPI0013577DB1|nr:DUF4998 domain-containing protein [Parabacteroides sp. Marseille-P3160]